MLFTGARLADGRRADVLVRSGRVAATAPAIMPIGDARGATADPGPAVLDHWAAELAVAYEEMSTFEFPPAEGADVGAVVEGAAGWGMPGESPDAAGSAVDSTVLEAARG